MSLDELLDFIHEIPTLGISFENLSFDQLTNIMVDADINVSELTDDQINQLMNVCGADLPTEAASSLVEQRFGMIETDWKYNGDGTGVDANGHLREGNAFGPRGGFDQIAM